MGARWANSRPFHWQNWVQTSSSNSAPTWQNSSSAFPVLYFCNLFPWFLSSSLYLTHLLSPIIHWKLMELLYQSHCQTSLWSKSRCLYSSDFYNPLRIYTWNTMFKSFWINYLFSVWICYQFDMWLTSSLLFCIWF